MIVRNPSFDKKPLFPFEDTLDRDIDKMGDKEALSSQTQIQIHLNYKYKHTNTKHTF